MLFPKKASPKTPFQGKNSTCPFYTINNICQPLLAQLPRFLALYPTAVIFWLKQATLIYLALKLCTLLMYFYLI
jgi:hypothetical protein